MASSKELQKLIDDLTSVQTKLIATGKTTAEFDKAVSNVKTTLRNLIPEGAVVQNLESFGSGVSTILNKFKTLNMELGITSSLLTSVFRAESLKSALKTGLKSSGSSAEFYSRFRDFDLDAAVNPPRKAPAVDEQSAGRGQSFEGLQRLLGSSQQVEKLQGVVKKLGFTFEDMKLPIHDVGSGITEFTLISEDGISRVRLQMNRLNKITKVTTGRFRTLGSKIAGNIAEVTKWTIAISVVYAPMRLMNQLVEDMIRNQTELANITIALGGAQRSVNQIFEDALIAGNAVGESVTGVLEGYTQAIRATGAITNQTERFKVVNQLLTDSLVLSKLSTLDQAVAMDTLVAALRQTATPLDEGVKLLDSWVATTKIANVDLATLATSFSITATAAKNAGLEFNELNGLIAVMAENTGLSATEVGNAVRAAVSGLDTDVAQKTLRGFGIEISNLEGELFGFMNTLRQIASMREAGLLSDADVNRIGIAIGGGVRRGPQIVALIENLSRVQDINTLTADAQGDAYAALDVQLETVQSALKRVGNEFQSLAQTLGTDGGLLDVFSVVLEVVEGITKAVTTLVGVLGTAGPVLATIGIAGRLGYGPASKPGGLIGGLGKTPLTTTAVGASLVNVGEKVGRKIGVGFGQLAPVLFMAGINASQGDLTSAGANIAGGIAGFLVSGGSPIGAIVGAGIAEAFISTFFTFESDLEGFFTDILIDSIQSGMATKGGIEKGEGEGRPEIDIEAMTDQLFKMAGGGNILLGEFMSTIAGFSIQVSEILRGEKAPSLEEARFKGAVAFAGKDFGAEIPPELRSLIETGLADAAATQAELGVDALDSGFVTEAGQLLEQNKAIIDKYIQEGIDKLREDVVTREENLTAKTFIEQLDTINRIGTTASQTITALGDSWKGLGPDVKTASDALLEVADILVKAEETDKVIIFKLVNQIAQYSNIIEEVTTSKKDLIEAQEGEISSTKDLLAVLQAVKQLQLQEDFEIPSLLNLGDISQDEVNQIIEKAKEIVTTFLDALTPNEEQQQAVRDTWKATMLQIGDEFQLLDEALPSFAINAAKSALGFGGAGGNVFDVRSLDLDSSRRGELNTAYQFIDQLFKQNFPKYEDDVQSLGVIWKDNVTDILHVDNLKLQLALQQLVDINQKQLDGIYNLPTDATLYVPIDALYLGRASGGGGGISRTSPDEEGGIFGGIDGAPSTGYITDAVLGKNALDSVNKWLVSRGLGGITLDDTLRSDAIERRERLEITGGVDSDLLYRRGFPADTGINDVPIVELKLIITATFQSILDGQMIANQVKTLVTDDMIRADGRSGGLTKSYVM